ncbi:hypothetical protein ACFLV3_03765 [Chloroflexota bacterium]
METTSDVSPAPVKKTWMPKTAGILSIVGGVFNLIAGIMVASLAEWIGTLTGFWGLGVVGTPLIIIGIVSITGGTLAIQRKFWGLALAGAICALFPPPVAIFGILSIIFLAVSKAEFS